METQMDPLDIAHRVRKAGTNMAALARANGLSDAAIRYSLRNPSKRAEEVLTSFLGVLPQVLWPDRYDAHGTRLIKRGRQASNTTSVRKSARRARKGQ